MTASPPREEPFPRAAGEGCQPRHWHRDRSLANANRRYAEVVAPERLARATRWLTCPRCGAQEDI